MRLAPELGALEPRDCPAHGVGDHRLMRRDRVERDSTGPELVEVWQCVRCASAHESRTESLVRSAFAAAFADAKRRGSKPR